MNDNDTDPNESEPKLVIDSDWKEQVAKEREQVTKETKPTSSANDFVAKQADSDAKAETEPEIPPPPPATFEILVSMMFTQAMSMLGQLPDPSGEMSPVNKPYAKHTIDTLEMLGEKTKGNLTEDESNMLSEALHALRMAYVNTKS